MAGDCLRTYHMPFLVFISMVLMDCILRIEYLRIPVGHDVLEVRGTVYCVALLPLCAIMERTLHGSSSELPVVKLGCIGR
jgi:hypothetical protein